MLLFGSARKERNFSSLVQNPFGSVLIDCIISRICIGYKSASKCDQRHAQLQRKGKHILQLAIGLRVSRRQIRVHSRRLNLVLETIEKRLCKNQYYSFDRKNKHVGQV